MQQVSVKADVVDRVQGVLWGPQPGPQTLFLSCRYKEVLFGGQAGGGKSDALIGDCLHGVFQYGSAWRAILFRNEYPNIEELEGRCLELFTPIWGDGCYKVGRKRFELDTEKGTAILSLRAMDERKAVYKYQGHQFSWIGFDELTQWPSDWWYEYLLSRLRSPYGVPCTMRATSNPGNVGHNWVKSRFMMDEDGRRVEPMTPIPVHNPVSGEILHHRIFIPSRLSDNRYLAEDGQYLATLQAMSDPTLRRAYMEGDWDIVAGAAFPEFRRSIHVVKNRVPPEGVRCWRSCDWGFSAPYCVLWFYRDRDGQIVVFHCLYGQGPKAGQGSQTPPSEVWSMIQDVEESYGIYVTEGWLDPQCWAEVGHVSDYLALGGPKAGWRKWGKGPQSRMHQKRAVHEALKVVNGRPGLVICENCEPLIQCLETIPLDQNNIEDVDTHAEDHAYDALRGGLCKAGLTRKFSGANDPFAEAVRKANERTIWNG